MANHDYMSTHSGMLPLLNLPKQATQAHAFPKLADMSLLSRGQLCDAGCTAQFDSSTCIVNHPSGLFLHGTCDNTTYGLWTISLLDPHCVLPATSIGDTQAQVMAFAHVALFAPTLTTLRKAINTSTLPDFPGLTEALQKFPPNLEATQTRHLDNCRKHQQLTPQEDLDDPFPLPAENSECTNLCYLSANQPKHIVYKVPVTSSQGNHYIIVTYDFDSNTTLLQPIKTGPQPI